MYKKVSEKEVKGWQQGGGGDGTKLEIKTANWAKEKMS